MAPTKHWPACYNVMQEEPKGESKWSLWLKRFGAAAFVFFLIKGLVWIALAIIAGKALFGS